MKSIPSPTPEETSGSDKEGNRAANAVVGEVVELTSDDKAMEHLDNVFKRPNDQEDHQELVQATEMLMNFEFQDIRVSLSVAQRGTGKANKPVLTFVMENLEVVCANKTYETVVDLKLKDLALDYLDHVPNSDQPSSSVTMINSRDVSKELLAVHFVDVNKQSPELHSRHKSVLKKLEVAISSLSFNFHQEGVIDLLQLSNDISSRIDAIAAAHPAAAVKPSDRLIASAKVEPSKALAAEGQNYYQSCCIKPASIHTNIRLTPLFSFYFFLNNQSCKMAG